MEEGGGGVDDGDVDRAVAAFVGEDEGDAEEVADEHGREGEELLWAFELAGRDP